MDKIKAFFAKKETKIVCITLFCISCAGLIIGGLSTESINGLVVAVAGIATAVSALIVFIGSLLK